MAALAFERFEEGRLLAADIGPGAAVDEDVQVKPGAQDVLSQEYPFRRPRRSAALKPPGDGLVFAPDIDIGRMDAHGIGGDDDPLDEEMGIVGQDVAVLERPGLAFVGVDAEILGLVGVLGDEPPFHAGREIRLLPAPAGWPS